MEFDREKNAQDYSATLGMISSLVLDSRDIRYITCMQTSSVH